MFSRAPDGGLLILKLKTGDLTGIVGLVLALAANAWLLTNYFYGAEVTMFAPEQIELRCNRTEQRDITQENGKKVSYRFCKPESLLTVVASSLAYSNEGADGYHAIIKSEWVDMDIVQSDNSVVSFTLYWQWFTNISNVSISKTVAAPSLIRGGEALAHETQFTSRIFFGQPAKRMLWSSFLELVAAREIAQIRFRFHAYVLGDDGPFVTSCRIVIDERVIELFTNQGMRRFQQTFTCEI